MSELKPCPFCGTESVLFMPELLATQQIYCKFCETSIIFGGTIEWDTKRFNSRPIEDALTAENAELKAKVAKMEEDIQQKDDAFDDLKTAVYNVLEADSEYTYEGEFCESSDFAIKLDDILTTKELVELMANEIYCIEKTQRDKQWDGLPEYVEIERLKADNARMREVLDEIINAYNVANGEYFCLNCGLVIATYEERCSECGADLSIEYDGLIKKAKQALKGGE